MGEEFDTDQLVEFCQRLGLADDGYLDEKQLTIVCNCIGLQAPEDMLKELFEELDTDKDGRVCLNELSQMLRGMPKNPASPEKAKKLADTVPASSILSMSPSISNAPKTNGLRADFSNINLSIVTNGDRSTFSILDPNNSGFTKVGAVIDMWLQWGIGVEEGLQILKEMGFPIGSRNNSLNVHDLTKALEEETDNSKDMLPLVVQTALLTYKTETQYLRSICESMECERDKLRSDIVEAHQRSSFLAQEVDEQNSRLEKNSQLLLHKMEAKYAEQIHELQQKYIAEKESLQQALYLAESQLKSLEGEENKFKAHVTKLNNENSILERELQNLHKDMGRVNKTKIHLEKEIARYQDLENKLVDMERKSAETVAINQLKLEQAHSEVQLLQDHNDELTAQLDTMRERVKTLKAFQEKQTRATSKRRKGSNNSSTHKSWDGFGRVDDNEDTDNDYPLEKIGKFHLHLSADGHGGDITMFSDEVEELETSLVSCGSQLDSGNYPVSVAINFIACMGESSTDPPSEYQTLECEMETVKEKIETIIVENQSLKHELSTLEKSGVGNMCGAQTKVKNVEVETQTVIVGSVSLDVEMKDNEQSEIQELRRRIEQLESEAVTFQHERKELKEQCSDMESSLDLLRVEYEKCEDYWHDKLQEARDIYEQDKHAMDEKFQDLLIKIKEYEETFMSTNYPMKLPPIEERASLEQQVTDLEEECDELRRELYSLKDEQDSVLTTYQRELESRAVEECGRLTDQVSVLTKKCKDYESRLSSLAEEERSTLEESGLLDELRNRVHYLESQLKRQEDAFRHEISKLERIQLKDRQQKGRVHNSEFQKSKTPPKQFSHSNSASPQSLPIWNNNNNTNQVNINNNTEYLKEQSKNLLQMLQHQPAQLEQGESPVSPMMLIWPQRYAHSTSTPTSNKSTSLPFIPVVDQYSQFSSTVWNHPNSVTQLDPHTIMAPPQGKKAWCHVELGWLQALRARLKQREDQCQVLQGAMQNQSRETERLVMEMRHTHQGEIFKFEQVVRASQYLIHEQTEKLTKSELLMKDLWMENAKLLATFNVNEQRVLQLENLVKYHMQQQLSTQQPPQSSNSSSNLAPRSLQYR